MKVNMIMCVIMVIAYCFIPILYYVLRYILFMVIIVG